MSLFIDSGELCKSSCGFLNIEISVSEGRYLFDIIEKFVGTVDPLRTMLDHGRWICKDGHNIQLCFDTGLRHCLLNECTLFLAGSKRIRKADITTVHVLLPGPGRIGGGNGPAIAEAVEPGHTAFVDKKGDQA